MVDNKKWQKKVWFSVRPLLNLNRTEPNFGIPMSSAQPLAEGQGKRTKISNKWYTVKSFIRHNDDDDWRVDI